MLKTMFEEEKRRFTKLENFIDMVKIKDLFEIKKLMKQKTELLVC